MGFYRSSTVHTFSINKEKDRENERWEVKGKYMPQTYNSSSNVKGFFEQVKGENVYNIIKFV